MFSFRFLAQTGARLAGLAQHRVLVTSSLYRPSVQSSIGYRMFNKAVDQGDMSDAAWELKRIDDKNEKAARQEVAVTLFEKDELSPEEIVKHLKSERKLSIATVRKYLIQHAMVNEDFYHLLEDPDVWERFSGAKGAYQSTPNIKVAISLHKRFEQMDIDREDHLVRRYSNKGGGIRPYHAGPKKYKYPRNGYKRRT
ncbi:hypothetical protein [Phaffia rhodozyma]|uniref:Uncharacterized protein n=1 Tax=Phaffia rhodozyma TaxID=264483 RepID=A0A0F7SQP8_PHARH|nr:hypothetical protein [Phaffia rhodozyma]